MDKDETLRYLQQKYPENLSDKYKCYWWWVRGCGLPVTYFLKLNKRLSDKDSNPCTCLRACSENPQDLIKTLDRYIDTNKR